MSLKNPKEVNFFIKDIKKKIDIGVAAPHWQLRDMLDIYEGCLIFTRSHQIYSYDTCNDELICDMDKCETIDTLFFAPSALSCNHGLLAVGGQRGQVELINLKNRKTVFEYSEGLITNTVNILNIGGVIQLMACNNDKTIKIFGGENMQRLGTIEHPWAVNSCSMSDDQKFLASVGDKNEVFLFARDGGKYTRLNILETFKDSGFSVSWNSTSTMFAVATQDGYVCMWDTRFLCSPFAVTSHQFGSAQGACRNVKFSKKMSIDLLMYTEHSSYVNFLDTRDFNKQQSLCIDPKSENVSISGAIFSETGDSVYVSTNSAIYNFSISVNSRYSFADYSTI
ncbi:hypothetical protein TCON_0852 [Astathelohania contejeani]|uniref:DUF2415 domain-containing protein n=1 Tax=Astathelohania contejeani TaxID=164912 RepID=A0ABQ7I0K0_9MICR|nr:hypothetical protein TCON_0852 [Thelohania contejeani]